MFVKRGVVFLPDVSLSELESLYSGERNAKAKIRLQCAVLRKKGKTQEFISGVTGKPLSTVSGILRRFEKKGVGAKDAVKQEGQPKKLSRVRRERLKNIVSENPRRQGLPFVVWTTKLVQYFVHKKYRIEYTLRQVANILKQLGLSLQKARPEHIKANKELQAKFKKNFDEELATFAHVDMRSYFWTNAPSSSNRTASKAGM